MLRILLPIHRYLAVAVGLLMALWCLSGFVMLFQGFPEYTAAEHRTDLAPLRFAGCCAPDLPLEDLQGPWRIEMRGDHAVLLFDGEAPLDLVTGRALEPLDTAGVLAVARSYAAARGLEADPHWRGLVDIDQWTIQTARRNPPAHRVSLRDAAGTELYVNGTSGAIFQQTTRRERVLAWLGAIPHWLYPTVLRQHVGAWTQVVIWTSVIGVFLTVTGLYLGIACLARRRDGSLGSPFRGWWYWHHVAGLVFGVLTLTWVFSGLMTMGPWGTLDRSEAAQRLAADLRAPAPAEDLGRFLRAAPAALAEGQVVQFTAAPLGGRLFVTAHLRDGGTRRLDADARPAPLTTGGLQAALAAASTAVAEVSLQDEEDHYWYGHKQPVALPVLRARLAGDPAMVVYADPASGDLRIVDAAARRARWLESALHSLDFAWLRHYPLWYAVAMLLLAGVTAVCITGAWMALQRVRRDLRQLRARPGAGR